MRASSGTRETLPFLENIPATQAGKRRDPQSLSASSHGAGNMGEVIIHLLFPNADSLGNIPCGHLLLLQELDDPLAHCSGRLPRGLPGRCMFWRCHWGTFLNAYVDRYDECQDRPVSMQPTSSPYINLLPNQEGAACRERTGRGGRWR
jgi:hypothetical protein